MSISTSGSDLPLIDPPTPTRRISFKNYSNDAEWQRVLQSSSFATIAEGEGRHCRGLTLREMRVRTARYLATSTLGVVLDIVNVLMSLLSCGIYIYESYNGSDVRLDNIDLALCAFFAAEYLLRLFVAEKAIREVFRMSMIVDFLTILPILFTYNPGGAASEAQFEGTSLAFLKFMRVMKVLRLLRVQRIFAYFHDEVTTQILKMALTIVFVMLLSCGLIHLVENTDSAIMMRGYDSGCDEDDLRESQVETEACGRCCWDDYVISFHRALYFVIVSITTVGYGDIAPTSEAGMFVVSLMIMSSLVLVPHQTNELLMLLKEKNVWERARYRPNSHERHIVVACQERVNVQALSTFLKEFLHSKHGNVNAYKVVLMGPKAPPAELQRLMKHPHFTNVLIYLQGSFFNNRDLERAAVLSADAVFLLNAKTKNASAQASHAEVHTEVENSSRAIAKMPTGDDAGTILRILHLKRYFYTFDGGRPRIHAQMLNPESKKNLEQPAPFAYDYQFMHHERLAQRDLVVNVEELKMAVLAQNCVSPGFFTLLHNLVKSRQQCDDFGGGMCEDEPWREEYNNGRRHEVCRVRLSEDYSGMEFCQGASLIFSKSGALLMALDVYERGSDPVLLINPTDFVFPDMFKTKDDELQIYGMFIALDMDTARSLSNLSFQGNTSQVFKEYRFSKSLPRSPAHMQIAPLNASSDPAQVWASMKEDGNRRASFTTDTAQLGKETLSARLYKSLSNAFGNMSDHVSTRDLRRDMVTSFRMPENKERRYSNSRARTRPERPNQRSAPSTTSMRGDYLSRLPVSVSAKRRKGLSWKAGTSGASNSSSSQSTILAHLQQIQDMETRAKKAGVTVEEIGKRERLRRMCKKTSRLSTTLYHVRDEAPDFEDRVLERVEKDFMSAERGEAQNSPGALPADAVENTHIVVCGHVDDLYSFLRPLRARTVPLRPIVVLHPHGPSPAEWARIGIFDKVYFVLGSPLDSQDLLRAGVQVAGTAVVLSNPSAGAAGLDGAGGGDGVDQRSDGKGAEISADASAAFISRSIIRINPEIAITTEMRHLQNVTYIYNYTSSYTYDFDSDDEAALVCPEFACGQIYSDAFEETLMAQSFYEPRILEMVAALVGVDWHELREQKAEMKKAGGHRSPQAASMVMQPHDAAWRVSKTVSTCGQTVRQSKLYRIKVPKKMIGKAWGDSVSLMLSKQILPVALVRGMRWGRMQRDLQNRLPYVYTNPAKDVRLRMVDELFVLSSDYLHVNEEGELIALDTRNFEELNHDRLKIKKRHSRRGSAMGDAFNSVASIAAAAALKAIERRQSKGNLHRQSPMNAHRQSSMNLDGQSSMNAHRRSSMNLRLASMDSSSGTATAVGRFCLAPSDDVKATCSPLQRRRSTLSIHNNNPAGLPETRV